jgi:NAD(P)-dependent dehydrogenase (short-subunit alcohol dehydrogenase family)
MASRARWTGADIPDQTGRTVLITGGNSGIGYEAAAALAGAGATVVSACRDAAKAKAAADSIRARFESASVETLPLDLASLASVRDCAKAFADRHNALDVLINNAGVMAIPRRTTADGFEMQFGTNHLGHFALTGLLLERVLGTDGARVVNVASSAHRPGRMRFDDLQGERRYNRFSAYGQSKLANLLFTYELQRRLEATGRSQLSVACHPGWAATNLQFAGPRMDNSKLLESIAGGLNRLFAQDAAHGALPTLYAATAPDVSGADYIGPGGFQEMWGPPKKVRSSARSHVRDAARRLWEISEQLTGVRYGALSGS